MFFIFSRSSMVQCWRSQSSTVANRCTACWLKSPYGIGWRTTRGRRPWACRSAEILRTTESFPHPVRTAHMEITGREDVRKLRAGPIRRKSAPRERTREARCMSVLWETSFVVFILRSSAIRQPIYSHRWELSRSKLVYWLKSKNVFAYLPWHRVCV